MLNARSRKEYDLSLYLLNSSSGSAPAVPDTKSDRQMFPGKVAGHKSVFKTAIALLAVLPAFSQTTINLATQGRNADFSSFTFTRPISVGATLPATCQVGQLFFNSAAAAGSNLYGCTATNAWTALSAAPSSSGGGATAGSGIGSPNPASVSFGNQTVSTTSPAQPVVFTNTGNGALSITSISLGGANAPDFNQGNNCGSTLAAGTSCTIAITFTPSVVSAESATLTIADNGAGSPHTIPLSGAGTSASAASGPVVSPAAAATTVGKPLTLSANSNVSWSLVQGSAGTLTSNGASAVYTPPSTMTAQAHVAGCPMSPADSIYTTRIDKLPVHSQSATWMGSFIAPISFVPSWGINLIDNSLPPTQMFFHYTTGLNGSSFQIPTGNNRKRETGALTTDPNNDHHMVSLNRQSCQFTETYQDGLPVSDCPACNAASGYQYNGSSYALPTQGSTDAAGLPLSKLMVHLSEIQSGVVKHALRFTLCTGCINSGTYLWPATTPNGSPTPNAPPMGARFRLKKAVVTTGLTSVSVSSGGSGYTTSPAVTISGCTTAPSATALISNGAVTGIALSSPGANCRNPQITFGGPGTGAVATATTWSPNAQILLAALQNYGMFLSDNGLSGQIQVDGDVAQDAAVVASINEINSKQLGASAFEVVDESSLMMAAGSSEVNPNNGYVTPDTYAVITATDSQGNKTTVPVAVQPILVGVQYPAMTIEAGMTGYQLSSWVTGSSNQAVTWTLASGPGTVTSAGVYTPPASIANPAKAVLIATAAADSTATATVSLMVVPSGMNPGNSIRIDVGSDSPYTDAQGNLWLADTLGFTAGAWSQQNDFYPSSAWGNIPDQTLYVTFNYTWGDDIVYGPFIVPNGNYKIGFTLAKGSCSGTYDETVPFDDGLVWGPLDLEANGSIGLHFDLAKSVNSACRVPYTAYVPATVTNNLLFAAVRTTGGMNSHSAGLLNALAILPDSTSPYLSIDTNYANGMRAGTTAQMYAVGWYMSNAVNWSVTGGGSIDSNGIFTAPSNLSSAATVTITATSTVSPSISASVPLTIVP